MMELSKQLAKHVRDFYFGGNYTGVHLKEVISDVTWEEATTKLGTLNSIAALVFHINYYTNAVCKVLQGGPLDAHDKYSYDLPLLQSAADWKNLQERVWTEAELFASLVEQLPDSRITEAFIDGKYGTYFRNIEGVIEHGNYHLGQISLIKKMMRAS